MAQLKSRGLVISDEDKAVRYLESIGYYRLSAYMYIRLPKPLPIGASGMGIDTSKIILLSWKPLCLAGKV